ncbi:MAG: hypothetical protein HQ519_06855, partial [Planctomycetes bacterium]|nr:hypothetical protein [Planctomycetota bacterium]
PKAAPDLQEVGWRVSPDYLRRFIAAPVATHPGTTMPQVMSGLKSPQRKVIAEAITQFLISQAGARFSKDSVLASELKAGGKLFHSVGCVTCHPAREAPMMGMSVPTPSAGAVGLDHLPEKYSLNSLSEFLHQPLSVRPSGRMPDMALTSSEARSIASYLIGPGDIETPIEQVKPSLVDSGRIYFQALGCVSCHALDGMEATPLPALDQKILNPERGCLAQNPTSAPNFNLSDPQRVALQVALKAGVTEESAEQKVANTLTAFNCIGCHVRDDFGGVSAENNLYFQTSEPSLGDDARIPPPLTEAGAKLNSEWFHKVMFDAASVRPYMHTRMPQFGEANLKTLGSLFESADPTTAIEMPDPSGDEAKVAREAGQTLLGADTLGCINCHAFNGKKSPAFNGIDLLTAVERLRPEWFMRFMIAPQNLRPGIVMPQGWPGGIASRTEILDGDTDAQLKAIWYFLSQGRTARDPKGIRSEATILEVADLPLTYRGRSRIAGFRGIAVGFPSGINYAFNANTGSLSGIWQGGFVRVRWDGQGAGDFDPASRSIALAQDVAFCFLATDEAPWPLQPVMDEENPVNPDPLYPRNLGYQFGGYSFNDASVPTLRYGFGDIAIEDTSMAGTEEASKSLTRSLQFTSPAAQSLHFRALTGNVEELAPLQFQTDALRLTIPSAITQLRPMTGEEGQMELILKLEIPMGTSTLEFHYEVL